MLRGLSVADARTARRGILAFVLFVILGLAAADKQINLLTGRADCVQIFNIRRDEAGFYHGYFFGRSAAVRAVFPAGAISSTDRTLTVAAGGRRLTVPTVVYLRFDEAVYWLETWRRQFIAEAYKAKRDLAAYGEQIKPLLRALADAVRR